MLPVGLSRFVDLTPKNLLDRSGQEIGLPRGLVVIDSSDLPVLDLHEVMGGAVKGFPFDLPALFVARGRGREPEGVPVSI
jgi:hypothetical protein